MALDQGDILSQNRTLCYHEEEGIAIGFDSLLTVNDPHPIPALRFVDSAGAAIERGFPRP